MKLLKVFITVAITASISLLLSTSAQALDHPWDDNPTDTTTVGATPQVGTTDPTDTPTITTKVTEWARLFFIEIKGFLVGLKHDVGSKPISGNKPDTKRLYPIENRK